MRIAFLAALFVNCQLLFDHPAKPVDAGSDAMGAPSDVTAPAPPELLWEGDPGPLNLVAVGDQIVFGTSRYADPPDNLWSVPKTGGERKSIAENVHFFRAHPDGDSVVVLEPSAVRRIRLDGTGSMTLATTASNRASALYEGRFYWTTRSEINVMPADGGAHQSIVPFDGGQTGSISLLVDSTGMLFGHDGIWDYDNKKTLRAAELWQADGNGADAAAVASIVDEYGSPGTGTFVAGIAKLDGITYLSVPEATFLNRIWRYDGTTVRAIEAGVQPVEPSTIVARAPFVYIADAGGIYRYEPATNRLMKLITAHLPQIDVDEKFVYWSEGVDVDANSRHRRLMRAPR